MKKLILLFTLASFVLTSCSSDDNDSIDPWIGTWTWHQGFENGVEYQLDDCDKQDSYIVRANGTLDVKTYFTKNDGTCQIDFDDSAIWENLGNNVYKLVYDAGTPEEDIENLTITFDGNTFYLEETYGQDTYKEVYIRN